MSRQPKRDLGITTEPRGTWVQTERDALHKMTALANTNPRALGLLTAMLANMQRNNALVASQSTLATISGSSVRTVQRAIQTLKAQGWIQVLQIGPSATVNAYVINDRVAWLGKRDGIAHSLFSAEVLVSGAEQSDAKTVNDTRPLLQIPKLPSFPNVTTIEQTANQLDIEDAIQSAPDERPALNDIDAAFRKGAK